MRKIIAFRVVILAASIMAFGTVPSYAQADTVFTGTALIYGTGFNTRTISRTFTLRIRNETSDSDIQRYHATLERGGQEAFLKEVYDNDLGRFSLGASVGRPINAVMVDEHNGHQRIRVVFARWIGFGELRYGARSVDYPFSYIEILIDPRTGRGEGTYFQAARIRARGDNTVEIEDFGTFPSRLMGVTMRGRRLL